MMIMTTMNFNMENIRIFLEQSFVVFFMNLNFPRTFLSYKIKTKTDKPKREEFFVE